MKKHIIYIALLIWFPLLLPGQTNHIIRYEYWFNSDYAGKVTVPISPVEVFNLSTTINAATLKDGFHSLNFRFRDQQNRWSSTQVHYFLRISGISAYEYWIDGDYENRVTGTLSSQMEENIQLAIPTETLKAGMHTIHFRTRSANGLWTSTQSQHFWKTGAQLTNYEYWFDENYDQKQNGKMEGLAVENWSKTISIPNNLSFDAMYVRFQDTANAWSNTLVLPTPPPVADFYFIQDRFTASFNSTAMLGKTHQWHFGDGTQSIQVNPSKTYTLPGEYFVKLVNTNAGGRDSITKQLTIRGIQSLTPNKAGNTGFATIAIIGGGLTSNANVVLSRTGFPDIVADSTYIDVVGKLNARFNLLDKETGEYSLTVNIQGQPPIVAQDFFTIEEGIAPIVWANISGNSAVLLNRWQTYTYNYGNLGNVDASLAPVWLLVSDIPGLELEFLSKSPVVPDIDDPVWQTILDSIPPYIIIDSLNGAPFRARAYPFLIQPLGAYETGSFTFRVKSPLSYQLTSWADADYFDDSKRGRFENCLYFAIFKAVAADLISLLSNQIPGAACVTGIYQNIIYYDYKEVGQQALKNAIWALVRSAVDCVWDMGSQIPFVKAYKLTKEMISIGLNVYERVGEIGDCQNKFKPENAEHKPIAVVASFDPNEIYGPEGFNDDKYYHDHVVYPYRISFENLSTATAPAQEVFVYDTLDAMRYNLSSFSFGNFGFSDTVIFVDQGLKAFSRDIDLRPAKNIILRVNGLFDSNTASIRWEFVSLDPVTMALTEDAFGGFLPPNINSPEGEGFVSFFIKLKPNLPHLDVISNKATIIFDLNEPIITNIWSNRIDRLAPESSVFQLPVSSGDTNILVRWGGADAHSGIAVYDVFVSINGGPAELWKENTWRKADIFTGQLNNTYSFYSVATDYIGNKELPPSTHDATILLTGLPDVENPVKYFRLFPNPSSGALTIQFNLSNPTRLHLRIFDVLGREIHVMEVVGISGSNQSNLQIPELPDGLYFCALTSEQGSSLQRLVIRK
jgi:PKD repeat protein